MLYDRLLMYNENKRKKEGLVLTMLTSKYILLPHVKTEGRVSIEDDIEELIKTYSEL